MHRQSLGSPASKLQNHGILFAGAGLIKDDIDNSFLSEDHRKDKLPSCSAGDEERKSPKSILVSSSTKLVHLIPLLTFLCFLVLYLSSHDPSRKDLAQFGGFTTIPLKKASIDSIDIEENMSGRIMEIEKNDVVEIRSMRNLQQQRQRLHRKLGH